MHTVQRISIRSPIGPRWQFAIVFVCNGQIIEIERFENAQDAYAFCSWINGGDKPELSSDAWDRITKPLQVGDLED